MTAPYRWLAGVGIALSLLIGAFFFGRSTGIDHQRAIDAKAQQHALAVVQRGRVAVDAVNAAYARVGTAQSANTRTIYETATRYVDRPVYRSVCIDADGVGLLDRAQANANRPLTGEPAGGTTSPAADAAP